VARRGDLADERLVAPRRAGDETAFTELHDRYRRPLLAYARRFLDGGSHDDAEDIVQDVFAAAHRALLADERQIDLRPWLYRVTRNRCIDILRRAHHGDVELAETHQHDARSDPFARVTRRETLQTLVVDIAGLPERQRAALLAREVDGASYDAIASELGITAVAARVLAMRARDNLVKAEQARTASCTDVRGALAAAHDRGTRPSEHARRHLQRCDACRAYRRELKRVRVRIRLLAPPAGLGPLAVLGGVLGSGGAKTAAVAVLAIGAVATGGVTVLATDTHEAGEPAPFRLHFRGPDDERLRRGDPIPRDTAVVTAQVDLAANRPRGERRMVTLDCPAGMRLAGFEAPEQKGVPGLRFYGLDESSVIGRSTRGRVHFSSGPLARAHTITVGIQCRRPGPLGSIAPNPRLARRGELQAFVCARSAYLMVRPGRLWTGTVTLDQPVAVTRTHRSGRWVHVIADNGARGWLETAALCGRSGKLRFGEP
jgi:RNA polymerase sigma factor (sigma-70 family)